MSPDPFTLRSFAKINLLLKVGGKRYDGFHELCTVFQTVSLHDLISFSSDDRIVIECSDPTLPTDSRNLVFKAAEALKERAGVSKGVKIRIEKRIPFPGGLGGGSSNAATALLGLSKLWGITPSLEDLAEIGAGLGSDVPFFLVGGTAIGTGRGTDLEPVEDIAGKCLVIVTPPAVYSTAEAYASLERDRLTSEEAETTLIVCRELAEKLISGSVEPANDFEDAVSILAPETREALDELRRSGAVSASLSGSGPSVFGIFENEIRRREAIGRCAIPKGSSVFEAETLTRSQYRSELGIRGDLLSGQFS